MVLIYINTGKNILAMVDGFIPDQQPKRKRQNVYELTNRKEMVNEGASRFQKICFEQKRAFCSNVEKLREDFCHRQGRAKNSKAMPFCFYECLDYDRITHILANCQNTKNNRTRLGKYLSTFLLEYQYDTRRGRRDYVQNTIVIDRYVCSYKNLKLCCANWIQKTNFEFKNATEYRDFAGFVSAWTDVLNILYNGMHVRIRGSSFV